jgi:hypothetical protein
MASILELKEWPTPATYLYEEHADALQRQLRRRFPSADQDLIYDAVIGAILDVALKFDRLKAQDDLHGLLWVAAFRNLMGSLRSDKARQLREAKKGNETVVEHQAAARKQRETLGDAEILERAFKTVPENVEERLVLEHWGADFQEIALALGWKDLPEAEQYKRVKTLRDRLGQRLRRLIEDPVV